MKTIKQPTAVIYLLLLSGEWGEVRALPELPDSNWKAHTAKTAPPSRREVHWGCPFSHGCPSQCLHNSSFILCFKSQRGPINTNNHLSFQLASLRCPSCFWRRNSRLRVRGIKARDHTQIGQSLQRTAVCREHRVIPNARTQELQSSTCLAPVSLQSSLWQIWRYF